MVTLCQCQHIDQLNPFTLRNLLLLLRRLNVYNPDDYPFEIYPLSKDNGGGYLISYPDFSECISDGETINEAIKNGREALAATIETLEIKGFEVPEPSMLEFA
jgi:antitoxin HicB